MLLPRQHAHIVGEDEVLEIARRAELHARHDLVELEAELRETRLADQHDGSVADQVGDDFARDLWHRGLLLLLACTEREPDRVEIEKHGHGVADLQHRTGKFEPGCTPLTRSREHCTQDYARPLRRSACASEAYRCFGCYRLRWHRRSSRPLPLPRPARTDGRSGRSAWSCPFQPAAARTSLRASWRRS